MSKKNVLNTSRKLPVLLLMLTFFGCTQVKENNSSKEQQKNKGQIPHLEKRGSSTRLIVEGEPFLMLSGELHNSTCGGFDLMRPVWKQLAKKKSEFCYCNCFMGTC